MSTYRTLILFFSSIFYCWFAKAQINSLPFILIQEIDSAYVYESKLNFKKNTFGGLLLAKKTNNNTLQIVLTSKFGMKIFDFTLNPDSIQTNYIVESLNKPIVKKMFYKDLKMLYPFLYKAPKIKHKKKKTTVKEKCKSYNFLQENNEIYLVRKGISTNKVEINRQNNKISSLNIIHSLIDLKIEVKPLTFAK